MDRSGPLCCPPSVVIGKVSVSTRLRWSLVFAVCEKFGLTITSPCVMLSHPFMLLIEFTPSLSISFGQFPAWKRYMADHRCSHKRKVTDTLHCDVARNTTENSLYTAQLGQTNGPGVFPEMSFGSLVGRATVQFCSVAWSAAASGKRMWKVVPFPAAVSNHILPPCSLTTVLCAKASPCPVPFPTGLVVKK